MSDASRLASHPRRPRPTVQIPQQLAPEQAEALALLQSYEQFQNKGQGARAGAQMYAAPSPSSYPGEWYAETPPASPVVQSFEPIGPNMPRQHDAEAGPTSHFPRYALLAGVGAVLLFLTGLLAFLLLRSFAHSEVPALHAAPLEHTTQHAIQRQDFSELVQNVRVFYYPFTTGPTAMAEERHPATGSLGDDINFSTLIDYNICCRDLRQRFVCMSGSAFNHGSVFFDAILQQDVDSSEVYLLLWLNSQDLVEVGCWLKASYLDS